jgi:hypothetical protein
MNSIRSNSTRCRIVAAFSAAGCALLSLLAGCQTTAPATTAQATNPKLRPIVSPKDGTSADSERALLARFVGVWSFEGWVAAADGSHSAVKGVSTAVIEDEHFVRLDMKSTEGQLGGRAARNHGTLMFASEPGIGLTLTAWGDGSPGISRLTGAAPSDGSAFTYTEAKTPSGVERVQLTITFQTDNQWTAEIRDLTGQHPAIASYKFTRNGS